MHVGCGDHDRGDQARVLVHAGMDLHAVGAAFRAAVIPLVAFLGLVHLRVPLPFLVFGGAGRGDQGGVHDRSLPHRHAPLIEVGLDGLKNLLTQPLLLQQVAEGEDCGLIRNPVAERIPLLQQMDPQHRGQRVWRPATFLARLGVVGLDQFDQCLPWHHRLHLSEKLLVLGLLLGCGQLIVRETELLAAHQPCSGLRSQAIVPQIDRVSRNLPRSSLKAALVPQPRADFCPNYCQKCRPLSLQSLLACSSSC